MLKITYYPTKNKRFPFYSEVSDGLAAAEVIAELRRSDEDLERRIEIHDLLHSLYLIEKKTSCSVKYPDYLRIDRMKEESAC